MNHRRAGGPKSLLTGAAGGRARAGVRIARDDAALEATRHRTQLAKVGLGERGTPWREQSDAERRTRWETALSELDALED